MTAMQFGTTSTPPVVTFDSRPKLDVCVANTGESYLCAVEESLLRGMLKLGRKGVPAGCVNGGCGVCKVRIVEGTVRPIGPISRAHVSVEDERCGVTLACRVAPLTAVRIEAVGRFEKPFFRPARHPGEPFSNAANHAATRNV